MGVHVVYCIYQVCEFNGSGLDFFIFMNPDPKVFLSRIWIRILYLDINPRNTCILLQFLQQVFFNHIFFLKVIQVATSFHRRSGAVTPLIPCYLQHSLQGATPPRLRVTMGVTPPWPIVTVEATPQRLRVTVGATQRQLRESHCWSHAGHGSESN